MTQIAAADGTLNSPFSRDYTRNTPGHPTWRKVQNEASPSGDGPCCLASASRGGSGNRQGLGRGMQDAGMQERHLHRCSWLGLDAHQHPESGNRRQVWVGWDL